MAARKGLEDLPYRPATIVAVSDVQGKSSSDGRVPIKAVLSTLRKQGEILGHLHPCPREVAERYRLFTDGAKDPILLVAFKSIKSVRPAIAALHRSRRVGRTRLDDPLWARQLGGQGKQLKKWRVIIRNVNFRANERAIEKAVERVVAFPWEVNLPKTENGKRRGFAFVGFMCRQDAQSAIEKMNGMKLFARTIAVDWAVGKDAFQRIADEEDGEREGDDRTDEAGSESEDEVAEGVPNENELSVAEDAADSEEGGEEENDDDDDEIPVAEDEIDVDRERGMMANALKGVLSGDEERSEENEQDRMGRDDEDDSQRSSLKGQGNVEQDTDPSVKEQASGSTEASEQIKPSGFTVFVRGLPLGTRRGQLYRALGVFGKILACRLVIDKKTRKFRGTAFVEFADESSARKAIAASKKEPGIEVKGVSVKIDVAKAQQQVLEEQEASRQTGTKKDRRNLYLVREGEVVPGSPAAEGVSQADMTKRQRFIREKQTKLKNPNFFVSPTRLSVKNLPQSYDEKKLKHLFLNAAKERAPKSSPKVTQAKILRSDDDVDEEGNPKPKGIGFVQFSKHSHALTALRQLNNNPAIFSPQRRPIVEFAVENIRAVRKLQRMRQAKRKRNQRKDAKGAAKRKSESFNSTDARSSKKQKTA